MLELILGGIGSAIVGSLITIAYQKSSGRLQTMRCIYIEDDVLSKIPQKDADGDITQNLHRKHFQLINTTNIDIQEFRVVFQFDETSQVRDVYSSSKEGTNHQLIEKNNRHQNQADATVKKFNRGDKIDFYITVANVNGNLCYVSESDALGFKIVCEDKTDETKKSKSTKSSTVLINNPIQS